MLSCTTVLHGTHWSILFWPLKDSSPKHRQSFSKLEDNLCKVVPNYLSKMINIEHVWDAGKDLPVWPVCPVFWQMVAGWTGFFRIQKFIIYQHKRLERLIVSWSFVSPILGQSKFKVSVTFKHPVTWLHKDSVKVQVMYGNCTDPEKMVVIWSPRTGTRY